MQGLEVGIQRWLRRTTKGGEKRVVLPRHRRLEKGQRQLATPQLWDDAAIEQRLREWRRPTLGGNTRAANRCGRSALIRVLA